MQWNCANCGESVTVASPLAAGQEPCPHCGRNLVDVEPPPRNEAEEAVESPPPEPVIRMAPTMVGKIVGSIGGALVGGLALPLLIQIKDSWVNDFVCVLTGTFFGGCIGGLFGLAMAQSAGPKKLRDTGGSKNLAAENRTRLMICIAIGAVLGCKLGTYLGSPSQISMFVGSVSGLFLGAILGGEGGVIVGGMLEPGPERARRVVEPVEGDEEEANPEE